MSTPKQALRAQLLAARAATPAADKRRIDQAVAARVLALEAYRAAKTVFVYVATEEEIETRPIIAHALGQGKTVCVPRCEAGRRMTARCIDSLGQLVPARFGLLEPQADAPVVPSGAIDLILAPALACDRLGYRLGYGGGFYDRFLSESGAQTAALCAEARLVPQLPREAHDQPCHIILTERQVLRPYEK